MQCSVTKKVSDVRTKLLWLLYSEHSVTGRQTACLPSTHSALYRLHITHQLAPDQLHELMSAPLPADERALRRPGRCEIAGPHFCCNSDKCRASIPKILREYLAAVWQAYLLGRSDLLRQICRKWTSCKQHFTLWQQTVIKAATWCTVYIYFVPFCLSKPVWTAGQWVFCAHSQHCTPGWAC